MSLNANLKSVFDRFEKEGGDDFGMLIFPKGVANRLQKQNFSKKYPTNRVVKINSLDSSNYRYVFGKSSKNKDDMLVNSIIKSFFFK